VRAGRDLVVQALERVTPQSGNDAFVDALELLKHAVSVCPELGDAWYYRSLVEKRLGHDSLANYALGKAQFNGSEALDQGLNPLELSTPSSRGITATEGPAPRPARRRYVPARCSRSGRWWLASEILPTVKFRTSTTHRRCHGFADALEDLQSANSPR